MDWLNLLCIGLVEDGCLIRASWQPPIMTPRVCLAEEEFKPTVSGSSTAFSFSLVTHADFLAFPVRPSRGPTIIELPLSMVDGSFAPRAQSTRLRSNRISLKTFRFDYAYTMEPFR